MTHAAEQRCVVVGNGLVGSAAARRLAELGVDVIVIGSSEPSDPANHRGVFSSHYDQGRLVSAYSADPIWARIARAAIDEFADVQHRSGIEFHHPVGRLSVVAGANLDAVRSWAERIDPAGRDLGMWSGADPTWREHFPFLETPAGFGLLHEGRPAGYINPRSMIRAQNVLAARGGARFVDDRVTSVLSTSTGVTVATEGGAAISADRAVIAAGAFTNFGGLLPEPLPLRLKTETTLRAVVTEATAHHWSAMPVVTYDIDDPDIDDIYMTPPILYPDGLYRIKMGCNTANESWPTSLDELTAWFRHGDSDADMAPMERALRGLVPGVDLGDVSTHRCIVTYTPSGYPTIDHAPGDEHGRLVVAVGGNGTGAQGSDTLGRLAAGLVHDGRWPDEFERNDFTTRRRWCAPTRRVSKAQRRARSDQPADTA